VTELQENEDQQNGSGPQKEPRKKERFGLLRKPKRRLGCTSYPKHLQWQKRQELTAFGERMEVPVTRAPWGRSGSGGKGTRRFRKKERTGQAGFGNAAKRTKHEGSQSKKEKGGKHTIRQDTKTNDRRSKNDCKYPNVFKFKPQNHPGTGRESHFPGLTG